MTRDSREGVLLGCLWPGGGAAKESDPKAKILAGADTTLRTPDQAPGGTPRSPRPRSRRSRAGSTSTSTSRRTPSTCSGPRWSAAWSCPASAHGKWWARRSSRPPGATCAGSARASGRRAVGGPGCSQPGHSRRKHPFPPHPPRQWEDLPERPRGEDPPSKGRSKGGKNRQGKHQ